MITRSNRIAAACLAISLLSLLLSPFCLTARAEGEEKSRAAKLTRAEAMVGRIGKGIVVDVTSRDGGAPVKVLYDPAQYDAVQAAGFQSVRIYVVAQEGPAAYKTRIDDALNRGLAVVISMWGKGQWASKPKEGIQEFVEAWGKYAEYYRGYPVGPCRGLPGNHDAPGKPSEQVSDLRAKGKALQDLVPGQDGRGSRKRQGAIGRCLRLT